MTHVLCRLAPDSSDHHGLPTRRCKCSVLVRPQWPTVGADEQKDDIPGLVNVYSLRTGKIHHFIAGKIHYFYGHVQLLCKRSPEGIISCLGYCRMDSYHQFEDPSNDRFLAPAIDLEIVGCRGPQM